MDARTAATATIPCQHCGQVCYTDPCDQRRAAAQATREYFAAAYAVAR